MLFVAALTALIIAAGIASLALAVAMAWDRVPPPPEPALHNQAKPGAGLHGPPLVATLEGRLS
jgi:hypothetical protein